VYVYDDILNSLVKSKSRLKYDLVNHYIEVIKGI
jgi:hypothetical protein